LPVSEFEKHWQHECQCLKEEYKDIMKLHPDAADTIGQVYKVLGDRVALAGCTSASIGESEAWSHIVKGTKVDRTEFCKVLSWKQLFSALYGMYSVALNDLKKGATDQCQEDASANSAAEGTQHRRAPRRWLPRTVAS
jgi:hypothetical protein